MARKKNRASGNPFRIKLPDGSKLIRNTRKADDGSREGYGNWMWQVYHPDRRPTRKTVNLYTEDQAGAYGRAMDYLRQMGAGQFDPWADTAKREGVTITDALDQYVTWKKGTGKSAATVETDRGHVTRFAASLPAGSVLKHVEPKHVEAYVNAPKATRGKKGAKMKNPKPRSVETKKRIRASLQHFFGWAVSKGMMPTNPAETVELGKSKTRTRDHVTAAEVDALTSAMDAAEITRGENVRWLRDYVLFAFWTGMRPDEIRKLRWSAVRLAERRVEVCKHHRGKTDDSRRTIDVRGEALAVLRDRADRRTTEGDGPVFTGVGGSPIAPRFLGERLHDFEAEAGVEKNVVPYSFRHGFISRELMNGTPTFVVAKICGTSVAMIEKHYGHFSPDQGALYLERSVAADKDRRARAEERAGVTAEA